MIAIWENGLSVGDPVTDAEHLRVIALLNELEVALSVGAPFAVIDTGLETLARAVGDHFARDGGEERVAEHDSILARVRRLRDAWRAGQPDRVDRYALMELSHRWITHIGRTEPPGRPHAASSAAAASRQTVSDV